MAFFNVATLEEKILFITDISVQFANNLWYNYKPSNHYKFWASIKPYEIGIDPTNIGIASQYHDCEKCCRQNYNLTSSSFISECGDMMIEEITLYKKYFKMFGNLAFEMNFLPNVFIGLFLHHDDLETNPNNTQSIEIINTLNKLGINEEFMEQAKKERVGIRELINTLAGLKKAMATYQITA